MISSKNMAGFSSRHNYSSGKATDLHWKTPISILETTSQTAYCFNFHVRDLGNFTVTGPSGSGKTVFLGFAADPPGRRSTQGAPYDLDLAARRHHHRGTIVRDGLYDQTVRDQRRKLERAPHNADHR